MMKILIYSTFEKKFYDLVLLFLRIIFGFEMAFYGLSKLQGFAESSSSDFWAKDVNFLGLGGSVSLGLVVFSELFCSILVIVGFLNRLALIPLIFTMLYIIAVLDNFKIISWSENGVEILSAFKFLVIYLCLFLSGPGKFSLDYRFFKI